MLEFRILGPLEVRDEHGRRSLSGGRGSARFSPRCCCARAGRADRAARRRALRASEPPKTATTSLQNAVVALREGARRRRPRHACARATSSQVDTRSGGRASASSSCSPMRGAPRRPSVEPCSSRRSSSGEDPRWPSSRSRTGRSPRRGVSASFGSSAVEERIATDIELGHPADVVAELESLTARASAARAALAPADAGAAPAGSLGGGAAGLHRRACRARRARRRAGRGALRRLQGEILRGEAKARARRTGTARRDADAEVVKALVSGRVVPVLGLDGGADLAEQLALGLRLPDRPARSTSRASRSTSRR